MKPTVLCNNSHLHCILLQGVNLAMILCEPSLYTEDGEKKIHPVIAALNALSLSADNKESTANDGQNLDTLKNDCDIDLSHRCFAGKNNAYPVLLKYLKAYRNENRDLFVKSLQTLCSLCNGQPDLLNEDGVEEFMGILRDENVDQTVTELIVKLIRLNCIKHEMNRRSFVKKDLIKELVRVLTANKDSAQIVKEVAYGLRVLTQDDDVRVPFGSAHENAKQIVIEGNALKELLGICKGMVFVFIHLTFKFIELRKESKAPLVITVANPCDCLAEAHRNSITVSNLLITA